MKPGLQLFPENTRGNAFCNVKQGSKHGLGQLAQIREQHYRHSCSLSLRQHKHTYAQKLAALRAEP